MDKLRQTEANVEKLSQHPPHKQYHVALKELKVEPKN